MLNLKYPKKAASEFRHGLNIIMYGVICAGLGAVCMFFITHVQLAQEMKIKSLQLEKDINKCADVVKEYVEDRKTILRQFADMEARFTRIEHLMHIPRSERHGAWKDMVEDQ